MFELILFLTAVAVATVIGAVLRDVHDDDPTRSAAYRPPHSHGQDMFGQRL